MKGGQFGLEESIENAVCRETFYIEDAVQHELRKPGVDARADSSIRAPEDFNKGCPTLISVVRQSPEITPRSVSRLLRRITRDRKRAPGVLIGRRTRIWLREEALETNLDGTRPLEQTKVVKIKRMVWLSTDRLIAKPSFRSVPSQLHCAIVPRRRRQRARRRPTMKR